MLSLKFIQSLVLESYKYFSLEKDDKSCSRITYYNNILVGNIFLIKFCKRMNYLVFAEQSLGKTIQ